MSRWQAVSARVGVCWIVLAMVVLVASAAPELKPDQAAARIDGKTITVGDLERECLARFGAGTLQQMIDCLIVDSEARKRGIQVTPAEIAERMKRFQVGVQVSLPQGATFADWLSVRRISLRELAAQCRMEIQLEKMVADKVTVTDEEVAKFYEANRERFRQPERMLVSHICVEKKEDAERIRQEIVSEKITFADAARKYSIDPYGRENGGLFGWIARGDSPFQQAAFALQRDGDISPVFQGEKGWEIVRRDAYQTARVAPFEEVHGHIREMVRQERVTRLAENMLRELRRAANVEQLVDFAGLNEDLREILDAARAGESGEEKPAAGARPTQ